MTRTETMWARYSSLRGTVDCGLLFHKTDTLESDNVALKRFVLIFQSELYNIKYLTDLALAW